MHQLSRRKMPQTLKGFGASFVVFNIYQRKEIRYDGKNQKNKQNQKDRILARLYPPFWLARIQHCG